MDDEPLDSPTYIPATTGAPAEAFSPRFSPLANGAMPGHRTVSIIQPLRASAWWVSELRFSKTTDANKLSQLTAFREGMSDGGPLTRVA